jgi:D-amino-acid oxidase
LRPASVWHARNVPDDTDNAVAIVGAGVSGLTCAVLFAEGGFNVTIFARETGDQTTSAAAAAIWFPYDVEPAEQVAHWSLRSFEVLREIAADEASGVAMLELRLFARQGDIEVPSWAHPLGARRLPQSEIKQGIFTSGYAVDVPVTDTSIYLDYPADRARRAGAVFRAPAALHTLEAIDREHALIINCCGAGAKTLVRDADVEPHRGQVAVVAKLDLPYAIVCDDPPLMYAIPRRSDCILGGTNTVSDNIEPAVDDTARIMAEAAHVLGIEAPPVVRERVGLRPFRRSGVRLERGRLADGRTVIHNYGHGGSGFTLSWGCAEAVFALATAR